MSEFVVYFAKTDGTKIPVEADDPDAAIELAYDKLPGSLCHHCSREIVAGEWEPDVVTDADGRPVWMESKP